MRNDNNLCHLGQSLNQRSRSASVFPQCSGERAIDLEIGIAWVVEMGNHIFEFAGSRAFFHCRTVEERLTRYLDYLDTL